MASFNRRVAAMDGAVLLRQQLASQLFNTGQEKVSRESGRLAAS